MKNGCCRILLFSAHLAHGRRWWSFLSASLMGLQSSARQQHKRKKSHGAERAEEKEQSTELLMKQKKQGSLALQVDLQKAPRGYVPVMLMGNIHDGHGDDDDHGLASHIHHHNHDQFHMDQKPPSKCQHLVRRLPNNYNTFGTNAIVFIKASSLSHPAFVQLLENSSHHFGYSHYPGPLRLPCNIAHLCHILSLVRPRSPPGGL